MGGTLVVHHNHKAYIRCYSMNNMFCHICLSEKVVMQLDNLTLCKECTEKVKEYYDESEIKKL